MTDLATLLHTHDLPSDTLSLVFSDQQAPIYALSIPQPQTLALWQQLRAVVASTSYWPLIIGHPDSLEDFHSIRQHPSKPWQDILKEAQQHDPIEDLLACENHQRRLLRTAFRDFRLNRERPNLTSYPTDAELEHYLEDYYVILATELGEDPDDYLPPDLGQVPVCRQSEKHLCWRAKIRIACSWCQRARVGRCQPISTYEMVTVHRQISSECCIGGTSSMVQN